MGLLASFSADFAWTHMAAFIWKVTWGMGSFGLSGMSGPLYVVFHFGLLHTMVVLGFQEDKGGSCKASGTSIMSLLPYSVRASLKISLDLRNGESTSCKKATLYAVAKFFYYMATYLGENY